MRRSPGRDRSRTVGPFEIVRSFLHQQAAANGQRGRGEASRIWRASPIGRVRRVPPLRRARAVGMVHLASTPCSLTQGGPARSGFGISSGASLRPARACSRGERSRLLPLPSRDCRTARRERRMVVSVAARAAAVCCEHSVAFFSGRQPVSCGAPRWRSKVRSNTGCPRWCRGD